MIFCITLSRLAGSFSEGQMIRMSNSHTQEIVAREHLYLPTEKIKMCLIVWGVDLFFNALYFCFLMYLLQ